MLPQCVSVILIGCLLHLGMDPALGAQEGASPEQYTTQIREAILGLGIGPDAETRLRLREGAVVHRRSFSDNQSIETTAELRNSVEVEGYISEAGEVYFTLTDSDEALSTQIAYRDVVEVATASGGGWLVPVALAGGIALVVLYFLCQSLCE